MPETKRPSLGEKVRDLLSGPLVAFGRHPSGQHDVADGARVPGYRLVRGPDGHLYGVVEPMDDR